MSTDLLQTEFEYIFLIETLKNKTNKKNPKGLKNLIN